jgi:hypothetical protein
MELKSAMGQPAQTAVDSCSAVSAGELENGLLDNEPLAHRANGLTRHEHVIALVGTFFGAAGVALLLACGVKTVYFKFAGFNWWMVHPLMSIPAVYFSWWLARLVRAHTGFENSPLTRGRTVAGTLAAIAGTAWMAAVITLLQHKGMDFRCAFFFVCG